ncbi:MAG: RDD family protein, partial [Culicoidibacterales bacterium]
MFMRFRRIFAVGIDSMCLFPYVFWLSVAMYNEIANLGSVNAGSIEFILWLNRGGVVIYLVVLFPLVYVLYEFICYTLFKQTLGQYFMQVHLHSIDFLTMLFRMFFTISLQIISVGLFNLCNIFVMVISGKTIIDYLSRSQPEYIDSQKIVHPKFKLAGLLVLVLLTTVVSITTIARLQNRCFEIECIEKIILKDVIDLQIQQRQQLLNNESQQFVKVELLAYADLAVKFPAPTALEFVPKLQQSYDVFEVSFEREFETYASEARVITIAAGEPWYILTAKHQLDQQKWQVLIWSENDQQFLPVRAV